MRKDIELLEGVQRRATKLINAPNNKTHEERLNNLNLTTLESQRRREELGVT
jgi:ribonuclease P/MRP protein subunit RPP40